MLTSLGHEVIVYSGEENDTVCSEHVPLLTERERRGWFGHHDLGAIHPITWGTGDEHWVTMNARAVPAVYERLESHRDLLLLTAGVCQQQIADALPAVTACEPGVGYEGVSTKFRAFESSAWMHHVYGLKGVTDGAWYDDVIPNYFDQDEFPDLGRGAGGYLLFIGRVTKRKGPQVAAQIADALGMKLIVAGPGATQDGETVIGDWVAFESPNVEYVGAVGIEERAELMGGAAAVIAPTWFLEPFGGVAVEAMLCGTPAVTTDWGAFRETVAEGVSGFRFRTLQEGVDAVRAAMELDREQVRRYALDRYSLEAVGPMFDRWFSRLDGLWTDGWETLPGRWKAAAPAQ